MKPILISRRPASHPGLDSLIYDTTGGPEFQTFVPVGIITGDGHRFMSAPESQISADELREIASRMDWRKRNEAGG